MSGFVILLELGHIDQSLVATAWIPDPKGLDFFVLW